MKWILTLDAAINLAKAENIIFEDKKITIHFSYMHQTLLFETEEKCQQYRDYIESLLMDQN